MSINYTTILSYKSLTTEFHLLSLSYRNMTNE